MKSVAHFFFLFVFLSLKVQAHELNDFPDWTRASRKEEQKTYNSEQALKFVLPLLKAAAVEGIRSYVSSTCIEHITKKMVASDCPLSHDLFKILAAQIGIEFFTIAYVLHKNGVEAKQVPGQALSQMYNAFVHSQTVKALGFLVPNIAKRWPLCWCESLSRGYIASYFIKAIPRVIIECCKQAIAQQEEDERLAATIFKNYVPQARRVSDNTYVLNSAQSPILKRLRSPQKSTI